VALFYALVVFSPFGIIVGGVEHSTSGLLYPLGSFQNSHKLSAKWIRKSLRGDTAAIIKDPYPELFQFRWQVRPTRPPQIPEYSGVLCKTSKWTTPLGTQGL
jgi:hypothetical protein